MGIFNNKQHDDNSTSTIHPDAGVAGASPSIFGSDDSTDQQLVATDLGASTATAQPDLPVVDVTPSTTNESVSPVINIPSSVPTSAPDLPESDIIDVESTQGPVKSTDAPDTVTTTIVDEQADVVQDTTIDASYDYAKKTTTNNDVVTSDVPVLASDSGDAVEDIAQVSSTDSEDTADSESIELATSALANFGSETSASSDFSSSPVLATPSSSLGIDSSTDDITSIKDQALQQLSPLISLLEQTPEEKFHTTMMLLQSTEDKSLIKEAYEAAQNIADEKAKAQALLDIINEINYLTQHG